ncbi:MAG: helix-turn-helix domain-containing protein [Candidatus Omnitrophota bacterium]
MTELTGEVINIRAASSSRVETILINILEETRRGNDLLENLIKNPSQPAKDTLTHEEAAAYLGIASQTLYDYVSEQKIPFSKVGRKNLFRKSELDNWIEENRNSAKGGKG